MSTKKSQDVIGEIDLASVAGIDKVMADLEQDLEESRLAHAKLSGQVANAMKNRQAMPDGAEAEIARLNVRLGGIETALRSLKDRRVEVAGEELSAALGEAIEEETAFFDRFQAAARTLQEAVTQYGQARAEYWAHDKEITSLNWQLSHTYGDASGDERIAASGIPGHGEIVRNANQNFQSAGVVVRG